MTVTSMEEISKTNNYCLNNWGIKKILLTQI